MKAYLKLQYKMITRKLSDGSHPITAYLFILLSLLLFGGLSIFLFHKTSFAPYLYILVSLYLTYKLSENRRNDFLKICFGNRGYRAVRLTENLIAATPFLIFLLCKQQFFPAVLLVSLTVLVALFNFNTTYSFTIPTPFHKHPFEFTVGFRNTFLLFFVAYGLGLIGGWVNNFNLGLFSLMLIFFTLFSFYFKPEDEYFVWTHSRTPAAFVLEKIRVASLCSFFLYIPVFTLLTVLFFEHTGTLLLVALLGHLYLITVILAKYAAYPHEIDLAQGVVMALCFFFPPLLIAVIPYFANRSTKSLNVLLQ